MNSLTPMQVSNRERDGQPYSAPRRWCWWWAWAGIAFTVIFLLAGWRWYQGRQIERTLDAIRALGEPVTPAELYALLPRVPPEKDCLLLYQADDRTWMQRYRNQLSSTAPFSYEKVLPRLDEAWEDQEFAEQFLSDCREDFARWHQAAAKGGAANYPIHAEEGYGGLVPWVQPVRGIARALTLEAYARARSADFQGAADSLHAALVIANSLENNAIAVSQLLRMASHRQLLSELKRLLPQADFSSADLARLQHELEKIDFRPGIKLGLLGDRVAGIVSLEDPTTMGYDLRTDGTMLTVVHHATRQQLTLRFLAAMERMVEIADLPWPEVASATKDAMNAPPQAAQRSSFDLDLLPEFLGHLMQYVRQGARTTAANQVAVLAVALTRSRRDHGSFPSQLADLVPEYLDEVPLDAMTGRPYLYTLDDDGLTLRSESPDDGNANVNRAAPRPPWDREDLIFRWPADQP